MKFSPHRRSIFIKTYPLNGKAYIELNYEGPGYNRNDKKKIFRKFQQLSAKPTG